MIKWVDKHIEIEPPEKPRKITATRLAAVLGQNRYSSPFKVWCEVTRTWEEPFKETQFTAAGKAIEPKQIEYMKSWVKGLKPMEMEHHKAVLTPTDMFGEDYFKTTRGDFFPDHEIFGGMWDSLLVDDDGCASGVLEFKTTSKRKDWEGYKIPEYYAQQAALYGHLLGVDEIIMVCTFLRWIDYDHPEKFVVTRDNTIFRKFSLRERYPDFEQLLQRVRIWWNLHVLTGISPDYDIYGDAEILRDLKKREELAG